MDLIKIIRINVLCTFINLIVVLDKVNDTINVFDLRIHIYIRNRLLYMAKSFGVNKINYEPGIFAS